MRRKTLANALAAIFSDKPKVLKALAAAVIEPGRRGETLDLEEFSSFGPRACKRI